MLNNEIVTLPQPYYRVDLPLEEAILYVKQKETLSLSEGRYGT
jgi:hypothetical protein